jgi:hypothetical protein
VWLSISSKVKNEKAQAKLSVKKNNFYKEKYNPTKQFFYPLSATNLIAIAHTTLKDKVIFISSLGIN